MLRRDVLSVLFALLLAGAPLVAASGLSPPAGAASVAVGTRDAVHWIGENATAVRTEVAPDENATLWFALRVDRQQDNVTALTYYVNLTSTTLAFENATAVVTKRYDGVVTSEAYQHVAFPFRAPPAPGNASYDFTIEAHGETENGTVPLGTASGTGTVTIAAANVPAPLPGPDGLDPTLLLVLGLLGVLVLGGGAYALKQRRDKARMNAAPRRSQALREEALERAAVKKPEEVQAVKEEIRQQEQVRERRRELQILDAKRADALKTMDLLKKRHETGGLTKLQYDTMVAKKQQDLARIEAEIAQMEAEDANRGSAA